MLLAVVEIVCYYEREKVVNARQYFLKLELRRSVVQFLFVAQVLYISFISFVGLNGAMSNISVGLSSRNSAESSSDMDGASQNPQQEDDDFHCFILDEMSRRCDNSRKRTPSTDVIMDSPTRKRSRLL